MTYPFFNKLVCGFFVLLLFLTHPSLADDPSAETGLHLGTLDKGSLITQDQAEQISKIISSSIKPTDGFDVVSDEVINKINKKLKELNVPEIVNSPDLKSHLSLLIGYTGSELVGAGFLDGKNKFCFPCTLGHNNFVWGITPYKKSKRNTGGQFYNTLQCFESLLTLTAADKNTINSYDYPATRILPIVGKDANRDGFYVVTDETIYFYTAELPVGFKNNANDSDFFRLNRIELPNEKTAVIGLYKGILDKSVYAATVPESTPFVNFPRNNSPIPLLSGGDKITPESLNALRNELTKQLDTVAFPKKDSLRFVPKPSVDKICPALDVCKKDTVLMNNVVTEKFKEYKKEFGCYTNSIKNSNTNAPESAEGAVR